MSQLFSPPATTRAEPMETVPAKRRVGGKWLKWVVLLIALLWIADSSLSILLQHTRMRSELTSRLESAFGRPVEVGSYDFSLWNGPVLQAESVTVAEDPRFGREYFLRADSIEVRPVWSSLLRGRVELGSLLLTRPSLNLVRDSSGDWNISEWLPKPGGISSAGTSSRGGTALAISGTSFSRIELKNGRINFKRGDDKLPYAFVNLSGTVATETPGSWRIDLETTPWRAAANLQQTGMLQLSGHVGGTSSRLRPANLNFSWTDVSVSDVLRLLTGDDYGVRGGFALSFVASTTGDTWNLQSRVELRQLHRSDLVLGADNTAANIIANMEWKPSSSSVTFTNAKIEAPHSNAQFTGALQWTSFPETGPGTKNAAREVPALQIGSSSIDMRDVLAWLRAFYPNISDALNVGGLANAQMSFSGWPPKIDRGAVSANDVEISGAGLRVPVRVGATGIQYDGKIFGLSAPATISFGDPAISLRLENTKSVSHDATEKSRSSISNFRLSGKIAEVRDVVATAAMFGWNLSRGWDVAGPVHCDVRWQGALFARPAQPVGFVEWGTPGLTPDDSSLRAPFLNQPIGKISARLDLKPGVVQLAINSAQAFGARWSGNLSRRAPTADWRFALSADRLTAANLDAWLNPRWRESFLNRMLPFLNSRAQAILVPEGLRAIGHISVDQFTLAPLTVRGLQGDLTLDGRHIALANATGQLGGGSVTGAIDARLQSAPDYSVTLNFSRVDIPALLAPSPDLANVFSGSLSGSASFTARGASRSDLVASLNCEGKGNAGDFALQRFDLVESLRAAAIQPGTSSLRNTSATFNCSDGQIRFQNLQLSQSGVHLLGTGTVGFNRILNIQLNVLSDDEIGPRLGTSSLTSGQSYQLSGSLSSPQISRIQIAAPRHIR